MTVEVDRSYRQLCKLSIGLHLDLSIRVGMLNVDLSISGSISGSDLQMSNPNPKILGSGKTQ